MAGFDFIKARLPSPKDPNLIITYEVKCHIASYKNIHYYVLVKSRNTYAEKSRQEEIVDTMKTKGSDQGD